MRQRSMTKTIRSGVGKILTACFVMLYVGGTSHLEWIHSLTHQHDVIVSHSNDQENDPCHRSIYHGDIEHGCHHDSHLGASDKCQMCDMVCHADQIFVVHADLLKGEFARTYFAFFKQSIDSYSAVILSSRAPPARV